MSLTLHGAEIRHCGQEDASHTFHFRDADELKPAKDREVAAESSAEDIHLAAARAARSPAASLVHVATPQWAKVRETGQSDITAFPCTL
ncbi:hypothetical protein COCON_G00002350 [Conger conger]|uniref:Uncharacterized protein n=1 Tax=Conger conger TaxID=82655 RepID=A0A9Q1E0U7_CONCO|nr:hypothetical protein COCON_G00002350 [Conger conger]